MSDVFISYSRKDKAFVERLHSALKQQNRETWVDWQDIPLTADWWQEIERGIEGSDTFVFVISPDSIASEVCDREINHAAKHHKRLVPIVHRNGFEIVKRLLQQVVIELLNFGVSMGSCSKRLQGIMTQLIVLLSAQMAKRC